MKFRRSSQFSPPTYRTYLHTNNCSGQVKYLQKKLKITFHHVSKYFHWMTTLRLAGGGVCGRCAKLYVSQLSHEPWQTTSTLSRSRQQPGHHDTKPRPATATVPALLSATHPWLAAGCWLSKPQTRFRRSGQLVVTVIVISDQQTKIRKELVVCVATTTTNIHTIFKLTEV